MQRFRRLVHHNYNIRYLEIISTRTNSQAGQTNVALSCGISGLEGNAIGASISIDMFKTSLLVLLTYCNRGGGGVSVCGLSYQDLLRQSRVATIGQRQICLGTGAYEFAGCRALSPAATIGENPLGSRCPSDVF